VREARASGRGPQTWADPKNHAASWSSPGSSCKLPLTCVPAEPYPALEQFNGFPFPFP